ncbi:hypothetical protein PV10_04370 [Exophiala mesophila]|uniref:Uncharacterized protein n=1 Tax=Exophiala mesophila TaxID=212818 RepID=A0A0D1XY28_EXOME|nr:uncharacterized protein PV10_04370 [Exophiala mesophila]KIV93131.1 hypothetical protein PV10_04370 [Exophiala mesophila]
MLAYFYTSKEQSQKIRIPETSFLYHPLPWKPGPVQIGLFLPYFVVGSCVKSLTAHWTHGELGSGLMMADPETIKLPLLRTFVSPMLCSEPNIPTLAWYSGPRGDVLPSLQPHDALCRRPPKA